MFQKRASGRESIHPARADRAEAVVWFDDIAVAGEDKSSFGVSNDQERFEMAKSAILSPLLGQFDGGLLQIARVFLEFAFEALEERKGVRSRPCKARKNFVIVKATGLPGGVFEHVITQSNLAIGDEDDFRVFADAENGCAV
jgi:hypothetical protein